MSTCDENNDFQFIRSFANISRSHFGITRREIFWVKYFHFSLLDFEIEMTSNKQLKINNYLYSLCYKARDSQIPHEFVESFCGVETTLLLLLLLLFADDGFSKTLITLLLVTIGVGVILTLGTNTFTVFWTTVPACVDSILTGEL